MKPYISSVIQSVEAVEYINFISAEVCDNCPGYDSKQSDGEAPVLELSKIWSTSLVLLLPSQLGPALKVSVRVQSMGQIKLFKQYT